MAKVTGSSTLRVEFHGSSSLINQRTWHSADVQKALNFIFGIKPDEQLLAVKITADGLEGEIGRR